MHLYIYVYVCVYACICIYIYILYRYLYTYNYMYLNLFVYQACPERGNGGRWMQVRVYWFKYKHSNTYLSTHVCMFRYTYLHTHIFVLYVHFRVHLGECAAHAPVCVRCLFLIYTRFSLAFSPFSLARTHTHTLAHTAHVHAITHKSGDT